MGKSAVQIEADLIKLGEQEEALREKKRAVRAALDEAVEREQAELLANAEPSEGDAIAGVGRAGAQP